MKMTALWWCAVIATISAAHTGAVPTSDLGTMMLRIAERRFQQDGLIAVSEEIDEEVTTQRILQAGRWPVVLPGASMTPCCNWLESRRSAGVVVVGDSLHMLGVLDALRDGHFWNNSALFVLVLRVARNPLEILGHPDVLMLHKWLVRAQVTNAVLAVDDKSVHQVTVFSLVPPNRPVCLRKVQGFTPVDVWVPGSDGNGTFTRHQESLLVPTQLEDCGRCEVHVSRTDHPALYSEQGRIFDEIFFILMEDMGCNLLVRREPSGLDDLVPLDARDRRGGSYDRAIRGEADVVLRYAWVTQNRSSKLTSSMIVTTDRVEMYSAEIGVALGHSFVLEIGILTMLGVVTIVHYILQVISKRLWGHANSKGCQSGDEGSISWMLAVWSMFADQSTATGIRKGPTWNFILWTAISFGAVTVGAIRRSLYATDAMKPRFNRFHNVEQVRNAHISLGVPDQTMYETLEESGVGEIFQLEDCFTDPYSCLRRLPYSPGRFGLLTNNAFFSELSTAEREVVNPLDYPFFSIPITTYFAKQHPLEKNYSTYLMRLHNSGITQFKFQNGWRPTYGKRNTAPKALRFADVAPVVVMLVQFMLPLAVLCFVAELLLGQHRGCYWVNLINVALE